MSSNLVPGTNLTQAQWLAQQQQEQKTIQNIQQQTPSNNGPALSQTHEGTLPPNQTTSTPTSQFQSYIPSGGYKQPTPTTQSFSPVTPKPDSQTISDPTGNWNNVGTITSTKQTPNGMEITVVPNQPQQVPKPQLSNLSPQGLLTNPVGFAESVIYDLGYASNLASQKGAGNNPLVQAGNTLYGMQAWGGNTVNAVKNVAGGVFGTPQTPNPFPINNPQQQVGATAAPWIVATALAPITGGASLVMGGVNVGISEAFNLLPKIPVINPNPTGKLDTNLEHIGNTFLQGEIFTGVGKGLGVAGSFLARQEIPIVSKAAQIVGGFNNAGVPLTTLRATAGRYATTVATQAGFGYAVGGPEGAAKGAVFGAVFGGMNEASLRGVTVGSISNNLSMNAGNLKNNFLNRFFPDWSTPMKVTEVGTFKEDPIYDMETPPASLGQQRELPYGNKAALPNFIEQTEPIVNEPTEPIYNEPTYNEPITYVRQPNTNSWGYERTTQPTMFDNPAEQPMMQKEFSPQLKFRETIYADPNEFPDVQRLLNNSWGFPRNTGIASVQRTNIASKPSTSELNSWGYERRSSMSPLTKETSATEFITQTKNSYAPFPQVFTQPQTQEQTATAKSTYPIVNFFTNPISQYNTSPVTDPFTQTSTTPAQVTKTVTNPDPITQKYPTPDLSSRTQPFSLGFLPSGFEYKESGSNLFGESKRKRAISIKREYPILTASQFIGTDNMFTPKKHKSTQSFTAYRAMTKQGKQGIGEYEVKAQLRKFHPTTKNRSKNSLW